MRPVRRSDLHCNAVKVAKLGTLCDFNSVPRDVLLDRMVFERLQLPHGVEREAARNNTSTTKPNTTGCGRVFISVQQVNADFMRMQTHTQHGRSEDRSKLVAYVDLLRLLIPFLI